MSALKEQFRVWRAFLAPESRRSVLSLALSQNALKTRKPNENKNRSLSSYHVYVIFRNHFLCCSVLPRHESRINLVLSTVWVL